MPRIIGIIPARYASQRFPAKVLALLGDKPIIQWVYEQSKKSASLEKVIVATDHPQVFETVKAFGGEVVITKETHKSGTDRCFEAMSFEKATPDYVINIQGDEPFIKPEQIDILAGCVKSTDTQIATLVSEINESEEAFNPNTVKVIFNKKLEAIYFSRHSIPYIRKAPTADWHLQHTYYKHIGIYAYRSDVLERITELNPSSLEIAESLEQLRWIENGYKIKVALTPYTSIGIDTPQDLELARKLL